MIKGTCSICGGMVVVPDVWGGIYPPTPICTNCGAVAAGHGPVIPMMQPNPLKITASPNSTTWPHPDGFAGGLTERTENGQDNQG